MPDSLNTGGGGSTGIAAAIAGNCELVAGALSSDPDKARRSGAAIVAVMTSWYVGAEAVRRKYLGGEASMFVLYHNVFDEILYGGRFYSLVEFLAEVLLGAGDLTALGRADLRVTAVDVAWPGGVAGARKAEVLTALFFFLIVSSLFPLGIGPETALLRKIGPGILWVGALLATMLGLQRMFAADHADGTLEQMVLSPTPLGLLVAGKNAAHWLLSGLPLVVLAPLLGMQFDLDAQALGVLVVGLLLGPPVLSLVGSIGAALTLGVRGGGVLLSYGGNEHNLLALVEHPEPFDFEHPGGAAPDARRWIIPAGAMRANVAAYVARLGQLFLARARSNGGVM